MHRASETLVEVCISVWMKKASLRRFQNDGHLHVFLCRNKVRTVLQDLLHNACRLNKFHSGIQPQRILPAVYGDSSEYNFEQLSSAQVNSSKCFRDQICLRLQEERKKEKTFLAGPFRWPRLSISNRLGETLYCFLFPQF